MLPSINKSDQVTAHLTITQNNVPKPAKKKAPREWSDDHILLSMTTPVLVDKENSIKKYKLSFTYRLKGDKKAHSHVIYFGEQRDYIFHLNKEKRLKRILGLKNIDNPFHSDYWTALLANKYPTLKEGLEKFNEYFIDQHRPPPAGEKRPSKK